MKKAATEGRKPEAQPSLTEPQKLWMEALRSGKYKWGTGQLRNDDNTFCCLGVACELALDAGVIDSYDGHWGSLAQYPEVRVWLGLRTIMSNLNLATINDTATRNPFKRIAKLIESKPEGLFAE